MTKKRHVSRKATAEVIKAESSKHRLINQVGVGAAVLAVVAVLVMQWVWRDPVNHGSTRGQATQSVEGRVLPLTPARRQYLEASKEASASSHSAEDWMAFHKAFLTGAILASAQSSADDTESPVGTKQATQRKPERAGPPMHLTGSAETSTNPGYHQRIDGSNPDSMIASINQITGELPDRDARTFQRSLRMLMVASLPIAEMVAKHQSASSLSQERLMAGVKDQVDGMNAEEVVSAARRLVAKLKRQKANHTGPFGPISAKHP